jgi:integrase
VTEAALKLAPLVFVRPCELRKAEWIEFDLDGAEWRIPAQRMKMRQPHVVPPGVAQRRDPSRSPSSDRSRALRVPPPQSRDRSMSENAITGALRRMVYSGQEMTHGFRTIASTCLNELGWHPDLIELQQAHAERNEVRAAYNEA